MTFPILTAVTDSKARTTGSSSSTGLVGVIGQVPPPWHGSNVMTQRLLDTLERAGVPHVFINRELSSALDEVGKFGVHKITRGINYLRELREQLARHRPGTVIYTPSLTPAAFVADLASIAVFKSLRMEYVLYIHVRGYERLAGRGKLWERAVRYVLTNAHTCVILSERVAFDIARWVPSERTTVIPNAIENLPEAARPTNKTDTPQVLYLANYDPNKGAREFIEAAVKVLDRGIAARFRLAGGTLDHAYHAELKARIASSGHAEAIELSGPIVGEDKDQLFASSDLFVFPTYYPLETFPLVILEAMRAGLPVISSDLAGIPDQVEDGVTGWLVDPHSPSAIADKIAALVDDPELRARMSKAGRARFIAQFTEERFEQRWAALAKPLVAG